MAVKEKVVTQIKSAVTAVKQANSMPSNSSRPEEAGPPYKRCKRDAANAICLDDVADNLLCVDMDQGKLLRYSLILNVSFSHDSTVQYTTIH